MESRKYFVKQVADSIQQNHNKHGESFIFGISGKWGEGKSYFLDDLENTLIALDSAFCVYRVNPWKFSSDKTSFLRNFLVNLSPVNSQKRLRKLFTDTSETKINWKQLAYVAALLVAAELLFILFSEKVVSTSIFPEWIRPHVEKYWPLMSAIMLPVVLAMASNTISVQKSNHAISTVDEFDDLLKKLLEENKKRKIVVFVDDLDRVTPDMARSVLDNLRTFFDKPEITFVVAGDHTVLEGHLGRELLPEIGPPEQLEEGRRFMKKIFNVYWRLPLPIQQELDTFLDEQFKKRETDLNAIFTPENRTILRRYLGLYFEKNFRQTIRFLDVILFTFKIIAHKSSGESEADKRYFSELTAKPLLVVRILMIQELCTPMFEALLRDYKILYDLEYAVEKKDDMRLDSLLQSFTGKLSSSQRDFIKTFLYEEPRFFNKSSLVVSDLQPFLYLAADASFGDSRGPSKEDFMAILSSGNPESVKNSLLSMGDERAYEAAQTFVEQAATSTPDVRNGYISTIAAAFRDFGSETAVLKIFGNELKSMDFSYLYVYPDAQKKDALRTMWSWVDLLEADLRESYVVKFPFENTNVYSFEWLNLEDAGPFTVRMVAYWLNEYYKQNQRDAIYQMADSFSRVNESNKSSLAVILRDIQNDLANVMTQESLEYRDRIYHLLKDYAPNGSELIRSKVLEEVSKLNNDVFHWARERISDGLWNEEDLEKVIYGKLSQASDYPTLSQILDFISANSISDAGKVWQRIKTNQIDLLIENFPSVVLNHIYAPNFKKGTQMINKVIAKIPALDGDQKHVWLDFIKKDQWMWQNVTKFPMEKVEKTIRNEAAPVREKMHEVLNTWGIEPPPSF